MTKSTTKTEAKTEETSQPKTIAEALVAATLLVGSVEKGSRNEFAKFDYASAEDMLAAARAALAPVGLIFRQRGWRMADSNTVEITYALSHVSGEVETWANLVPVFEAKGKPIDKALSAALTTDYGYSIRGLLCLPRTKGDDVEGRDDRYHEPQQPVYQPTQARRQPTSAEVRDRAIKALDGDQDLSDLQSKLVEYLPILTAEDRAVINKAIDARKAREERNAEFPV